MKKCVLELGGSDPFILLSTDDLDGAVDSAIFARTDNNGQACNAGKRMVIIDGLYDAFVEKFTEMQSDLDKERRSMMRMWAKREAQIRGVLEATAGMYGDLQGIAGKALEEIDGMALPMLEDFSDDETDQAA